MQGARASCQQDRQDQQEGSGPLHTVWSFRFDPEILERRSTTTNVTGMMKTEITVAASIPPITTVPSTLRETAPAPVAVHKGTMPRINAKAVIRIGLRRSRAAASAASTNGCPFS